MGAECWRPRGVIVAAVAADRVEGGVLDVVGGVGVVVEPDAAGRADDVGADVELTPDRRQVDYRAVDEVEPPDRLIGLSVDQREADHVGEHPPAFEPLHELRHRKPSREPHGYIRRPREPDVENPQRGTAVAQRRAGKRAEGPAMRYAAIIGPLLLLALASMLLAG
jgi:hypothetical protein